MWPAALGRFLSWLTDGRISPAAQSSHRSSQLDSFWLKLSSLEDSLLLPGRFFSKTFRFLFMVRVLTPTKRLLSANHSVNPFSEPPGDACCLSPVTEHPATQLFDIGKEELGPSTQKTLDVVHSTRWSEIVVESFLGLTE
jgi:hypothetical protein